MQKLIVTVFVPSLTTAKENCYRLHKSKTDYRKLYQTVEI